MIMQIHYTIYKCMCNCLFLTDFRICLQEPAYVQHQHCQTGVNICRNALQTCREEFQSMVIWKRVFSTYATFQKKQKLGNQDF